MQTLDIKKGLLGSIGNTPLIRLNTLSDITGCEILGKAEFLNPGGSVKDRAALGLIEDAEAKGLLRPGGLIVEGTAGNTGIGLTLVANAKGYRTAIVMPETQSQEKKDLLLALGADLHLVPALPYSNTGNYNHVAKRLSENTPNSIWANQFDNKANREMHYRTTGPEIWKQSAGTVTAFVSAVGTGGTLAGTSRYLKEQNPSIKVICADPHGAAIWSWFKRGNLHFSAGDSITEGIGQGRVTGNLEDASVDDAYRIGDPVIIEMLHFLLKKEGLFLGSSAALNVCGALRLARLGGPGQVIVTVLCDVGSRYLSKIYNPTWLAARKLTPQGNRLESFWDQLMDDGVSL
jgi:cysteine synthase A